MEVRVPTAAMIANPKCRIALPFQKAGRCTLELLSVVLRFALTLFNRLSVAALV